MTNVASRTITVLTDDFDGKELKPGEGQTVSFSVGRTQYQLDLSDKNAEKFYDALKPYTEKAQKVGRTNIGSQSAGAGAGRSASSGVDKRAVRAWAASNNIELSSRGRIPANIIEQYRAAGN